MNPARLCPLLVAVLLTVSPGLIRGADSEGTVVKLSDLPAAAQATIKEHQGRGRLGEIVKTIESGEAHYDVEVTKQGRTRSLYPYFDR